MIWRLGAYLGLAAGLGVLALVVTVSAAGSLKVSAALVPGLAAGGYLVLHPFAALVLLVTFSHLDAIASLLSQALPLSAFKLLSVVGLGGLLLMGYRKPRVLRLGPPGLTRSLVILFLIWLVLSFLTCKYPEAGRPHLTGFASVIVLFFLITALTGTAARLRLLVWVLTGTGFVSALFVLAENLLGVRLVATETAAITAEFEGQARSSGASNYNPTTASHMMLATVVIAIVLFCEHPRWRLFSGLVVLVGMAALVLSLARSAAIAFALTGMVYLWSNRRHRLFPLAMAGLLLSAAAAVPFIPEIFWERMGTIFEQGTDRTLLRRLSYNLIGVQLLWENPLLGVGPGNYPEYYAGDEFRWYPGREPVPRRLHNSYMEIAAELGLVGLALFAGVIGSALKAGLQAARAGVPEVSVFARAVTYGFGAFLVASLFMPNADTKFMWILPALCVAARNLCQALPDSGAEADRPNTDQPKTGQPKTGQKKTGWTNTGNTTAGKKNGGS